MDSFRLSKRDHVMLELGREAKEETRRDIVLSILAAILANMFQNTVIYSILSPILSFCLMHNAGSCLESPLEQDCIASPAIISLSQATLDTTIFLDLAFGVFVPAWFRHINGLIPSGQNIGQLMTEATSPGIFLVVKHLISSRAILWKVIVGIWAWKLTITSIGAGLLVMITSDIIGPWLILVLVRSISFTIGLSSVAASWITKLVNFLTSCSTRIDNFGAGLTLRFWNPGQYSYRTLQKADHIRILKLCQRVPFLPLRCELIEAHVDRAQGFEALSYTWNDEKPQHYIIVDGRNLKVTNQVRNILHYRQSFFMESYLWIDAICIDQDDLDERSAQVAIMRKVYRGASRVLVWLGLPGEVSKPWKTITFIISLLAARDLQYTPEDFARFLALSEWADFRVEAVSRLLSHRWFTRSWVIQEVARGFKTHVMYGGVVLDWLDLASAMDIVTHDSLMGRFLPIDPNKKFENLMEQSNGAINITIIEHMRTQKKQRLGAALYRSRNFDSTLPHDRVFALLGFIDGARRFNIDYRKHFTEIYHAAAIYVLAIEQDHEIFSLAGLGNLGFNDVDPAQHPPSWVPDWRIKGNPFPDVFNQYSKTANNPRYIYGPRFRIKSDNRILQVQGNKIGRIQHISKTLKPTHNLSVFQNRDLLDCASRAANVFRYCSNWIKESKAMAHQYGRDPYHTFPDGATEDIDTAFWHTITWDTFDNPEDRLSISECESLWEHFDGYIPQMEELVNNNSSLCKEEWFVRSQPLVRFINLLVTINRGCRFAVTEDGSLCLVSIGASLGDSLYRVTGMQTALVTRKTARKRKFVGKCYYHMLQEFTQIKNDWFYLH